MWVVTNLMNTQCVEGHRDLYTGPLDSLVHYSMLQLNRNGVSDASMVKLDIERWLSRLQQVDPFRRRRYAELRKSR
jgi:hypothetical protein